ncbi:MAG: DUF3006 domain-containing protein [Ruminococcaceae bacterium]|nr:DUF3006 domain-containing protein [Oscillospiraceae bacterium]
MKKIFCIDRIEGDVAVCISDDGEKLDVALATLLGMRANDVFEARFEDGELKNIVPMPEERDRRLERNRKMLHDLARRSKKQS